MLLDIKEYLEFYGALIIKKCDQRQGRLSHLIRLDFGHNSLSGSILTSFGEW